MLPLQVPELGTGERANGTITEKVIKFWAENWQEAGDESCLQPFSLGSGAPPTGTSYTI